MVFANRIHLLIPTKMIRDLRAIPGAFFDIAQRKANVIFRRHGRSAHIRATTSRIASLNGRAGIRVALEDVRASSQCGAECRVAE